MFQRFAALAGVFLLVLGAAPARAQSAQDPVYVFRTSLGRIAVQLYPDIAPQTVANFLNYVNSGAYTSSIIHRSVPGFVVQGGGFQVHGSGPVVSGSITSVPTNAPVVNEYHLSNTRGTIAMAKVGNDPNSATSQWFFNEADNSANLNNQNGGFTVFGKIVDAASLAVMDQIAALPIYNEGPPFDSIPLINYQSGSVQVSNLVTISSIVPEASHVLWTNTNGQVSVWNLSDPNPAATCQVFGSFPGWTAKAIAEGPDGNVRLLWTNTDGRISVWNLADANPSATCLIYGPYSGWTAKSLAVGPDNAAHLLWDNAGGPVSLWNLTDANPASSCLIYGPYSGWFGTAISIGPDNHERLLWNNTDGRVSLWNLVDAQPDQTCQVFGPYSGWSGKALAVGPDNAAHLLWDNAGGPVSLWNLTDASPASSCLIYGPYSGWAGTSVALGTSGQERLLWDNAGGQISVWNLSDPNPAASCLVYGPYSGWAAVGISAAP